MSDYETREKSRAALTSGDWAAFEAAQRRHGTHPLQRLIGQWVILETWKMIYRGCVVDLVIVDGQTQLAMHPCARVGDYNAEQGIQQEVVMVTTPEHPSLIPWQGVAELSGHPAAWPKINAPRV